MVLKIFPRGTGISDAIFKLVCALSKDCFDQLSSNFVQLLILQRKPFDFRQNCLKNMIARGYFVKRNFTDAMLSTRMLALDDSKMFPTKPLAISSSGFLCLFGDQGAQLSF